MDWDDIKEYIICKISNPQVWIGVLIIVFGYCHCYLTDDIQGGSGYYFHFGYVSSTSNEAKLSLFLLFSLVGLGCFIYGLRSDFLDERPMLSAFVFVYFAYTFYTKIRRSMGCYEHTCFSSYRNCSSMPMGGESILIKDYVQ